MTLDTRTAVATSADRTRTIRRADIQGLRAIAVLLVIAFHAHLPLPGGFIGVDVFFVISGFVITAMLMREHAASGRLNFGHFYLRRFLRLTPALALTVTVVALTSILLENPFGAQQTTARTGLGAMLLSANFVISNTLGDYFAGNAVTNPLLNTWSLSVEEQFYLVFPAVLAIGWAIKGPVGRHVRRRPRYAVRAVAVIAAGSFALSLLWTYGSSFGSDLTSWFGGPETFAFYSPFTRAWEFAVGALLAMRLRRLPRPTSSSATVLGIAGAALVIGAALTITEAMAFPGVLAVVPVAGTALLLYAGSGGAFGVNRLLAVRPMVYIGDLSYSWYLWHWPVIVFTALLFPRQPLLLIAAAALSFVPSVLSYRFIETPIRRMRPKSLRRKAVIIGPTLILPLAACITLLVGANAAWGLLPDEQLIPVAAAAPVNAPAAPQAAAPAAPSPVTPPDAIGGTSTTTAGPAAPSAPAVESSVDPATAKMDGAVAEGDGGSLRSQHVAVRAGCVNTALDPKACRFGPKGATDEILLGGDSQAYAVADGVISAAQSLGLATVVSSHTGCPLLGRESSGSHSYPCRSWQKSLIDYALANRPAAVVIANRSAGYVHPEWKWRTAATDSGGMAGSTKEAATYWRKGLEPIVKQLSAAGIPVVFLGAVPEMTGYTNATSLLSNRFGTRDFDVPRAQAEAALKPASDVEKSLASQYPGVHVFDSFPSMCDDTSCWAVYDDEIRYQDEDHLSVPGSLRLADGMASTLRQAIMAPVAPIGAETPAPQR